MLSFDLVNFICMIINVLILFFLAKKFLFGRVDAIIEKRNEEINHSYEAADKVTAEATRSKKEYEDKLESIETEKTNIINEAAKKANAESDAIIEKANSEAAEIVKTATEEANHIRQTAEIKHDKEVERVVFDVAAHLAGQAMSEEANSELYDKFLTQAVKQAAGELNEHAANE